MARLTRENIANVVYTFDTFFGLKCVLLKPPVYSSYFSFSFLYPDYGWVCHIIPLQKNPNYPFNGLLFKPLFLGSTRWEGTDDCESRLTVYIGCTWYPTRLSGGELETMNTVKTKIVLWPNSSITTWPTKAFFPALHLAVHIRQNVWKPQRWKTSTVLKMIEIMGWMK